MFNNENVQNMLLETSKGCLLASFDLTGAVQERTVLFPLTTGSYLRNPQTGDGKRGENIIATTLTCFSLFII